MFVTAIIMTCHLVPRWRCEIFGLSCDHPGQGHREHAKCGQAEVFDQMRARVSSWPPLRPARFRRERGSVGVASPAGSRLFKEEGADETCDWNGHPPHFCGSGFLGRWPAAPPRRDRHHPLRFGRVRPQPGCNSTRSLSRRPAMPWRWCACFRPSSAG